MVSDDDVDGMMVVLSTPSRLAIFALDIGHIPGLAFLILTGLSSYFSYVPYGAGLYERKIAFLKLNDVTSAFPLQISDSFGCLGTFVIFLVQNLGLPWDHVEFYRYFSYFVSLLGTVMMLLSAAYFIVYKPRRMGIVIRGSFGGNNRDNVNGEAVVHSTKIKA